MMNSLETRAPFLDLDVIKEAFEIPISYKLNKNNKVILRKLLLKFLPEKLITKPKRFWYTN